MAKILIIDDDPEILAALGKFLRRQGHEVISAPDGQAGLSAAREKPNLIICDITMPGLNGHGVIEALRRDKGMADVPFIFLSGSTSRETVRQSMNLGGDDFIPKPAELPEILEAVNSRLSRQQRQQQRQHEEVKKAVQIFAGIVNDLGNADAAIEWLAEAAAAERPVRSGETTAAKNESRGAVRTATDAILVTRNNRRYFVKLSEVKALLADGEYSRAYWGTNQNMMFRKALKQWEQELPTPQFIRIHRKAIINLAHLDFVGKTVASMPEVHLRDFAPVIEVSQRKTPALNRALRAYHPAK